MEYKLAGETTTYIACSGTQITGLAAGDYKAKTGYNAGSDITVTVPAYVTPRYTVTVINGAGSPDHHNQ